MNVYEVAFNAVAKNKDGRLVLVHGLLKGHGTLEDVPYGHAWLEEDGSICYDPAQDRFFPKSFFYRVARVVIDCGYSAVEAQKAFEKSGHCGPWDEQLKADAPSWRPNWEINREVAIKAVPSFRPIPKLKDKTIVQLAKLHNVFKQEIKDMETLEKKFGNKCPYLPEVEAELKALNGEMASRLK